MALISGNMRKRAAEMGGEFDIISTLEKGTTTRLRIFAKNQPAVNQTTPQRRFRSTTAKLIGSTLVCQCKGR